MCVSCGATSRLSVHHVTPARLGGSDKMSNLVTLCRRCHDAAESQLRRADNPSMVTFTSREW
jgi:5-methylcytosine-specific restriction endonuclease McrA